MNHTEKSVEQFIVQQQLLSRTGKYLVAVSGGADSVALLLMLQRLGYQVDAVHCNFQLRGDESHRDEVFVADLCKSHAIALHRAHFDTHTFARLHKVSIEMAARQLRYAYFEQLRKDTGTDDVCVAHHQDDNAETILLNLLRGTGIHGLTGMHPRQGHVVRPFLCIGRQQILDWLHEHGQNYVTDSSNLIADVWRNKLRLNVIPQLCDITPQATQNILKTAALLAESARVSDYATADALNRLLSDGSMMVTELLSQPSPLIVLHEWLSPLGFSSAAIMQLADSLGSSCSGRCWLSATHELCLDRGRLLLQERRGDRPTLVIPEPGTYAYEQQVRLRVSITADTSISRSACCLTADADAIRFPLTLRPVALGDRFIPLGMKKGSRLVSDFLTDLKLSVFDKRRQLILTDSTGTAVWLVGQRPDHRCRVTASTTRVLRAEMVYPTL